MVKITSIEKFDPRVWGITVNFTVLENFDEKSVNFKDGTVHKTKDFLIADNTANILFNLWDEKIGLLKKGKNFQVNNARMTVFNNVMKLTTSRTSEIKEITDKIIPNLDNKMSEKKFKPAKKVFF